MRGTHMGTNRATQSAGDRRAASGGCDRAGRAWPWWIAAVVSAALVVGALNVTAYRNRLRNPRQDAFPQSFGYSSLESYRSVPEEETLYRAAAAWDVTTAEPNALYVDDAGGVWVAGADGIERFSPDGQRLDLVPVVGPIRCLATAELPRPTGATRAILCGSGGEVTLWEESGKPLGRWNSFGEKAIITSLAVAEDGVFIADAGNRVIHHVDLHGEFIGQLAQRDRDRGIVGLVVPSPYLDVAWGDDGLLRVVNPGVHRVEYYRPAGDLEFFWGKAGLGKDAFCGCCNPAHIALLPDGSTVTLEKGLLRVKVFSPQGEFRGWVAGPDFFGDAASMTTETRDEERTPVPDLATDARGRILVLDSARSKVFVFEPKTARSASGAEEEPAAEGADTAVSDQADAGSNPMEAGSDQVEVAPHQSEVGPRQPHSVPGQADAG
ncbi:MAG: hypothetical protein ACUVTW_13440 [Thermogutta sp.]